MSSRLRSPIVTRTAPIGFVFDGRRLEAHDGETVAAALLANGVRQLRKAPRDGEPRGAFCLIGLCQECVVEIDGHRVEACRVPARDGLVVSSIGSSPP